MSSLKLSVVMGSYNQSQYIKEALVAVTGQSWQPFELIICDDASTDSSPEIIRDFAGKYPFIRFVENKTNLGPASTFGRLMELARGDYLYATSADDKLLPGFFEKSMGLFTRYPEAGISSGLSFIIDEKGKESGFITVPVVSYGKPCFFSPRDVRGIFQKQGNWICGCATIVRLDYLRSCGGYRGELYSFQDNFVYQVIALKFGACFVPEPVMCYRRSAGSYSMAISNNTEIFASLIEKAVILMQTEFSGVFPEKYVEAWRRENCFILHYNRYKKICRDRIGIRAEKKSKGPIENFFFWGFRRFIILKKIFFLFYLLFVFRQNIWKKCYNKTMCFFVNWRFKINAVFCREKGI